MAIIGYLESILKYNEFDILIKSGLAYLDRLNKNHFKNIDVNNKKEEEIKSRELFAINQVYFTKDHKEEKFEGHKKYIDLQYIFEGEELIKIASLKDCLSIVEYNQEKDVQFFKAEFYSTFLVKKGMIAIFYPDDIHAPCLNIKDSCIVKKSVVKVLV